jgi:hypothetical protein
MGVLADVIGCCKLAFKILLRQNIRLLRARTRDHLDRQTAAKRACAIPDTTRYDEAHIVLFEPRTAEDPAAALAPSFEI